MKHQIEDALLKALRDQGWDLTAQHVAAIADISPIIERALRAAYMQGCHDELRDRDGLLVESARGVTVGLVGTLSLTSTTRLKPSTFPTGQLNGAPPPSDAAPVAWRWEETGSGDPIRLHSRRPTGKVTNLRALVYAHNEDAPPEVTEEMVEVFGTAYWCAEMEYQRKVKGGRGTPYRDAANHAGVFAGLRAALTTARKEGK